MTSGCREAKISYSNRPNMPVYDSFLRPLLFTLPPEAAHTLGTAALRTFLCARPVREAIKRRCQPGEESALQRFGLSFPNPIGMAAGFDKNGKLAPHLAALGFGFVEVGTVTLAPQPGNPSPRMFRLAADSALINRLGFNNDGADAVAKRLERARGQCVIGVNIGRNKDVPNSEAVANYVETFRRVAPVADYIAVNVSSPNTPGLRNLQGGESLDELLAALQETNRAGETGLKPLLVKIAPDLDDQEIDTIVDLAMKHGLAGIIATNTTVGREGLTTPGEKVRNCGEGGLSGMPLRKRSTEVISRVFKASGGRLTVVGVGGIFTPEDAFEKVLAGASLLQAYTGFVYKGPMFAKHINEGLGRLLREEGYSHIDEAVGTAVQK